DGARARVTTARAELEAAEEKLRAANDRQRRAELDRERGAHELDEVAQRIARLETDRERLADELLSTTRAGDDAAAEPDAATARATRAAATLEEQRALDRELRDHEAAARAELFRTDEALTSVQAKVGALESLERERVGLAPAAARLLAQRATFGDGAVLG